MRWRTKLPAVQRGFINVVLASPRYRAHVCISCARAHERASKSCRDDAGRARGHTVVLVRARPNRRQRLGGAQGSPQPRGRQRPPPCPSDSLLPVARAMCDRLAALDGLVPPAAVARSMPSSPNAYRAVVQLQQQLEKTASVPDLQQKRHDRGDDDGRGPDDGTATDRGVCRAAPASACADSKSDGCLTDACQRRTPVTSLSGTFLTPPKVSEPAASYVKHNVHVAAQRLRLSAENH